MSRIRVRFSLVLPRDKRATAERALQNWHKNCGMYRTVGKAIDITGTWEIEEVD